MFKQHMIDKTGEFHRIYRVKKAPLGHYVLFRNALLWEEYNELKDSKSKVDELDAITDMLYVASGTLEQSDPGIWLSERGATGIRGLEALMNSIENALTERAWIEAHAALIDELLIEAGMRGFDIEGAFDEVHTSNMSKLDDNGNPIFNAKGKVLKGPNFKPPRLERFTVKEESTNA